MRHAIARVIVARGRHQALAGQRRYRRLGESVHVRGRLVAIIDAAQLNRALSGLCKGYP